jgi:hypothetical protein
MIKTFIFGCCFLNLACYAQRTASYNLAELLSNGGMKQDTANHAHILNDPTHKGAITTKNILWLKNFAFGEGRIDIDLRGKDVFLQSFLGIAFHGTDSAHYELVYFRPFNFRHADSLRRKWSVQYMVVPDYLFDKLRKEHPLVYENAVTPVPKADQWFHASIVVRGDLISVFVNHSETASLKVKKLPSAISGMIGLWDDELTGDFANLEINE